MMESCSRNKVIESNEPNDEDSRSNPSSDYQSETEDDILREYIAEPQLFGVTEESTSLPSNVNSMGFFDLPSEQGNPLDPSSQGLISRYSGFIEGRINISEPVDECNTRAEHYQAGEHAFIPDYDFSMGFPVAPTSVAHVPMPMEHAGSPAGVTSAQDLIPQDTLPRFVGLIDIFSHWELADMQNPQSGIPSGLAAPSPQSSLAGPTFSPPPWGMQSADQGGDNSRLEGGERYPEYMMDDEYGSIPVYEGIDPFGDCLQD